MEQSQTPAPKAKGKTGLTAAQIKAQEEAEERKRFYENLKNSRGGQKPFTDDDLKMFKTSEEQAQDVPVPYPFLNDESNRNYIHDRFTKKPPRDGVIPADRKMIVTEYSLDHWLAQSFKLNLENIPPVRPSHIPKSVYEQLKKYIKYGNVNYDAAQQQQQQQAKQLQQQQRSKMNRNKNEDGGSPMNASQSEKKSESQHNNRPHKYTIIIYPKSMKVKPVVDLIEERQGIIHSETMSRVKENSVTNFDNNEDKEENGKESLVKARTMSRSRNQNFSITKSNFNSTNGHHNQMSHQPKKMLKLPNYKIYSRQKRNIRARIFSDNLGFLNPTEIELAATSFDKYLTNMRNLHSQQQSSTDVQQILLDNTTVTKIGQSPKIETTKDEKIMSRRLNNFNSRRISKDGAKTNMFIKNNQSSAFNFAQDRRSNDQNSINTFNQNKKSTDIGKSPYTNFVPTSQTQGNFSDAYGSLFQKFSSPKSVGSPADFDNLNSPRSSLIRSAGGSRFQKHLDQIKLTTIKSKFSAFKVENEVQDRKEESERLALIVNRNKNIQVIQNSPLPPKSKKIFIEKTPLKTRINEQTFGDSFKDQFSQTTLKLQNHLFPANKSVTSKLLKTLETTNITEILEDKNIILTAEEKATLSQRNHQRISNIITQHLEDEIEESRTGARDNISINMVEITMDFNELQKRINDMNNPVFWLQKAIQKLRVASVVAIEGAIDYYKQGLRITPQSEPLLYNIACSYEKIGKYENAIRWFQHVIDITPKHADSLYGLSLSYFKLTRYDAAIPFIEKAIDYFVKETCLTKLEQMIYFRCLCYKKTGDKNRCLRDYESLRPEFIKNLNQSLVSYVFGILMLPLQEERKLITNFIENFNELLIFYKNVAPTAQSGNRMYISQFCITKKQPRPWKFDFQKYKLYIYYYLSKKSFFKRIPTLQVFSQEIEESLVFRYSKNEPVLIPSCYVGVILVGTLFVLSHAEIDIMKPRLLFKCNEGSIIGNEHLDNGVTSHSETWLLAYESSEVIFFKKEHFQRIWEHQRLNTNRQIILSTLQKNLFFYHLNQQLKYLLVYEMLQERVYMPGEMVVHQSKRSYMNKLYRPLFEDRISKLRIEIESKKMTSEANTGKKQTEIGSLMAVFKDTHHIKKQIIHNSTTGVYTKRDDNTDPYLTLKHHNPKFTHNAKNLRKDSNAGDNDQYHDTLGDQSDYKGGTDSNVQLLFDNQIDSANVLIPQCADQDEEFLGEPYCQGIYFVHSGQINIIYEGSPCYTLKNGDSFGESVIIKQPSYEYFGNLVAGPYGAKCYLFTYDVLRNIPFKIIIDLVDAGGFMRKKEGLLHILQQKYNVDTKELSKY